MPRQGIGHSGEKKRCAALGPQGVDGWREYSIEKEGNKFGSHIERFRLMDTATPAKRQYGNHMIGKIPLTT